MSKHFEIEREGQIAFFDNYHIPYDEDNSILVDNTDGVYKGNLLEFKLSINNLNRTLFQAVKYLSRMRIKGESVPATILLIDLNNERAYQYNSEDYRDDIQKVYIGAASKNVEGFSAGTPVRVYDYSDQLDSSKLKKQLVSDKAIGEEFMPVDIDENCVVGWAERYYREIPNATKGDFLGDDSGQIKIVGEIREPKHFKNLIRPYTGGTNERFKYLMDCLNDRLSKKDLGAFYTPKPYADKAAELVQMAVNRALDMGKEKYIILDRCAGTGNLEDSLIGLYDKNGGELISHAVVSTYEYYEYKVLNERLGDKVLEIIPPTEADVDYQNGKVGNADAMSKEFIENPIIRQYIDDPEYAVILYENPPYSNSSASTFTDESGKKHKTERKTSYVGQEFRVHGLSACTVTQTAANDLSNLFIWSGFFFYLRQTSDSYVVFSPVGYFKTVGLVNKEFRGGYLFNRGYFHATDSAISCVYWKNIDANANEFLLDIYDLDENEQPVFAGEKTVKKVRGPLNVYYDKRKFTSDIIGSSVCDSNGMEKLGRIGVAKKQAVFNENILAYIVSKSWAFGAMNYSLTRVPYATELDSSHGYYLRRDNYLTKLPIFCSKFFPQDVWYEKDIYATTSDGGDAYTKDKDFLKSCLIYTCLSNQNKCLTFEGSDGRHYQNELCFDRGTVASADLAKMTLDTDEQELLGLWYKILDEARATGKCNPDWTYGVYQITKEINTFEEAGTGKNKKRVYDYPQLNGDLETLRTKLKEYYKSHITAKMFEYELLK